MANIKKPLQSNEVIVIDDDSTDEDDGDYRRNSNNSGDVLFESANRENDDDIKIIKIISHVRPLHACVQVENDKELFSCVSCFSMVARSYMLACPLGHYLCRKCFEHQIEALVSQSTADPFKCYVVGCYNKYPMGITTSLADMLYIVDAGELGKFLPPFISLIPTEANYSQNATVCLPTYWSVMNDKPMQKFILVPLTSQSNEFDYIASQFLSSMRSYWAQIVSIKRVENEHLLEFYAIKKQQMEKDLGSFVFPATEEMLFHGTSSSLVDVICQENFDWRLASTYGTAYGQGAYFSRDASYSHYYTDTQDSGQLAGRWQSHGSLVSFMAPSLSQPMSMSGTVPPMPAHFNPGSSNGNVAGGPILTMFVARVLVGRYCRGDPSFRLPPYNNNPADALYGRKYDSCVNNVHNPSIYVIFDTAQCYPEYIIEYRVNAG